MADGGSKTSEPEAKAMESDVAKEVLAPADGQLRNNLVATAVSFLRNERIKSSPLSQKMAFLEKKGLTKEEIDAAIEQAGISREERPLQQQQLQPLTSLQPAVHPSAPLPLGMPPPLMAPLPSRWERMKDLTLTSMLVAGLSYGLYMAFQRYLRPVLFGKSADELRLERLEAATRELQETLVTVRQAIDMQTATLSALRDSTQRDTEMKRFSDGQSLSEIKGEITSLKGLLLNRRQFPPTPSTSPLLPAWQREVRTGATSAGGASTTDSSSLSLTESNSNVSVREETSKEDVVNGDLQTIDEESKTASAAGAVVDDLGEVESESLP